MKLQTRFRSTRRDFIKTGTVTAGSIAFGAAFTAPACEKKNLSTWVVTIVSAFSEIKPLLSQLGLSQAVVDRVANLIDKGASIARSFDEAYKAGKFADAVTLFSNLGGVISEVATTLNVTDHRIVKLALVSISIARIAIASLLQSQADAQPQVARAVRSATTSANERDIAEIRRLASMDISKLEAAVKP